MNKILEILSLCSDREKLDPKISDELELITRNLSVKNREMLEKMTSNIQKT